MLPRVVLAVARRVRTTTGEDYVHALVARWEMTTVYHRIQKLEVRRSLYPEVREYVIADLGKRWVDIEQHSIFTVRTRNKASAPTVLPMFQPMKTYESEY